MNLTDITIVVVDLIRLTTYALQIKNNIFEETL